MPLPLREASQHAAASSREFAARRKAQEDAAWRVHFWHTLIAGFVNKDGSNKNALIEMIVLTRYTFGNALPFETYIIRLKCLVLRSNFVVGNNLATGVWTVNYAV